jgi:hypothetical protein
MSYVQWLGYIKWQVYSLVEIIVKIDEMFVMQCQEIEQIQ